MATDKQIQANRLNAAKSTGPRSDEGKAASSQNALKTGIHAESQIIRGEDPASLEALTREYYLEYQPQSASERALVDVLLDTEWLLRRLRKAESHLWDYHFDDIADWREIFQKVVPEKDISQGMVYNRAQQTLARLERRRDVLQRAFRRTLQDLRDLQSSRPRLAAQVQSQQPPAAPAPVPAAALEDPPIGFVPKKPLFTAPFNPPRTFDPSNPVSSPYYSLTREMLKWAEKNRSSLKPGGTPPKNAA